jgi:hypothetical protein
VRKLVLLLLPALILATTAVTSAQQGQTITVQIGPGRDAATGTGTATLTDLGGGRTRVVLQVGAASPNMPAHIHADPCPGVGAVVFALSNVMNGQSTTEINAPLSEVLQRGRSINVHRSPQEISVYVGCGNLPASAAAQAPAAAPAAMPRTGGPALPVAAAALAGLALLGVGVALRRR